MAVNTKFTPVKNGIKMKLYDGFPFLHMQISRKPEYTHAPDWHYNIEYKKEKLNPKKFQKGILLVKKN